MTCEGIKCSHKCNKKGGVWASEAHKCYAYDILETICIVMDRAENDFGDVEWSYYGGCFANGSPARYIQAEPETNYLFEEIRVEVRSREDPFLTALEVTHSDDAQFDASYSVLGFISVVLFVAAIGVAAWAFIELKELKKSFGHKSQNDEPGV